ncbi:MAG: DUF6796 family protein [Eubacteriales bacterium]
MELNLVYSIIGLLGGIFCAIGDLLLDLKGKDNVKVGNSQFIESNWVKMSNWRFKVSIVFGCMGSFMIGIGVYSLGNQIATSNFFLSEILILVAILTAMTGFFVHSMICINPIIYKAVLSKGDNDLAEYTLNEVASAIIVVFGLLYSIIILLPTGIIIYCILNNLLDVPTWFVMLNPVVFLLIGVISRKIYLKWFYELPGIVMPSLGFGMFGLIGIINLI